MLFEVPGSPGGAEVGGLAKTLRSVSQLQKGAMGFGTSFRFSLNRSQERRWTATISWYAEISKRNQAYNLTFLIGESTKSAPSICGRQDRG